MTQKYFQPTYGKQEFHCIYCNVYASQQWAQNISCSFDGWLRAIPFSDTEKLDVSYCHHCNKRTLWINENILYPKINTFIQPHEEMSEELKKDFEEAISIVNKSPRGAAALLRLVVQKLMKEVGEKGDNINQDISNLVKKGLHPHIQQALDYCRVVGNNAVHPGEIKLDDSPEIANTLFEMINLIIEELIARPKRAQELFANLPEGARKAIEKRDQPKT